MAWPIPVSYVVLLSLHWLCQWYVRKLLHLCVCKCTCVHMHLQSLLVSWMTYWVLASLCDRTSQHASSFWVTSTCNDDNMFNADLCLLLTSATLWEYLPISNLVSYSNTLSWAILRSSYTKKKIDLSVLFVLKVYIILEVDGRMIPKTCCSSELCQLDCSKPLQ